jgi:hypothetical protein
MLQPTIRIDGQAKNVDHPFAHTGQMFADQILLMDGLQRMLNIHDSIDQRQQPQVRDSPRDLERDATGQAGRHKTDGSTRPLSSHVVQHGLQIGLHILQAKLRDQPIALSDMIHIVEAHDMKPIAGKIVGQRHIVALAFPIPGSQHHNRCVVRQIGSRPIVTERDTVTGRADTLRELTDDGRPFRPVRRRPRPAAARAGAQ